VRRSGSRRQQASGAPAVVHRQTPVASRLDCLRELPPRKPSTRAAQSAAHAATIQPVSSPCVCGEPPSRFSHAVSNRLRWLPVERARQPPLPPNHRSLRWSMSMSRLRIATDCRSRLTSLMTKQDGAAAWTLMGAEAGRRRHNLGPASYSALPRFPKPRTSANIRGHSRFPRSGLASGQGQRSRPLRSASAKAWPARFPLGRERPDEA
jgi:hypothetical protein